MQHLLLPTLLIIADHPSVRAFLKKHLDTQFFLLFATRKTQALQAVGSSQVDFIILDSAIEDCDPLELSCELRNQMAGGPVPILLITGRLKKDYREQALDSGVTDFLQEQLDPEELEERIAVARKAATVRKKTSGLSAHIATSSAGGSSASLKTKFVLPSNALKLLSIAKNAGAPVATLLVQLDRFPELSLKFGTAAVEKISSAAAEVLRTQLHANDVLLPFIEGQCIVLLSHASEAKRIATALRSAIAEHLFEMTQGSLHLSASIALSTLNEASEQALQRMVSAANKALEARETVGALLWVEHNAQA